MKKFMIFIALISLTSQNLFAEILEIQNNTLPRGVKNLKGFSINVTIKDILPTEFNADFNFEQSVGLIIRQADPNRELPTLDTGEQDLALVGLGIENRQQIDMGVDERGFHFVTVRINVSETTKKLADILGNDNGVYFLEMRALYTNSQGQDFAPPELIKIVESVQVANAAPGNFSAVGSYKSLRYNWNANEEISFTTGNEAKTGKPNDTIIVVFNEAAANLTLPTYKFLPDEETDEAGNACYIDYSKVSTAESCVVCDDNDGTDKIYLNTDELAKLGELQVRRAGTRGTAVVNDLDADRTYVSFSYYLPDGLVRSQCITAQPTLNMSWSEYNGEGAAKASDPKCFIATAAYGTALDPRIDSLRLFRDKFLLTHKAGRWFVKQYYAYSPYVANIITETPVLAAITRTLLKPLVIFAEQVEVKGVYEVIFIFIGGLLLVGSSLSLFYYRIWGRI